VDQCLPLAGGGGAGGSGPGGGSSFNTLEASDSDAEYPAEDPETSSDPAVVAEQHVRAECKVGRCWRTPG
jgi:hypothetical protein